MVNTKLNKTFYRETVKIFNVRRQLDYFSIKQIIRYTDKKFLFLDSLGTVYDGRMDSKNNQVINIDKLNIPSKIKSMIEINQGAILVSDKGEVWTYVFYVLYGISITSTRPERSWKLNKISPLTKIIQAAYFCYKYYFLNELGQIHYCVGHNTIDAPTLLAIKPAIKKMTVCLDSLYLITQDGEVWCCNQTHALGKIIALSNIMDVIYVDSNSKIYFINYAGEVLHYPTKSSLPERIEGISRIQSITSNNGATFYVDNDENVFVTGKIIEIENGEKKDKIFPKPVHKFSLIKRIFLLKIFSRKYLTTMLVNSAGDIFICQSNDDPYYFERLQLINKEDLNDIDNGYLCSDYTLLTTRGGKIVLQFFQENNKEIKKITLRPYFNFAAQYHLDVIHANQLSMEILVNYACTDQLCSDNYNSLSASQLMIKNHSLLPIQNL